MKDADAKGTDLKGPGSNDRPSADALSGDLAIERVVDGETGRYLTEIDGYSGVLIYQDSLSDGEMIRTAASTRVARELSGRGVGLELVKRLVVDARAENAKIDPHCSFVRVMMVRHKDWHDVLVEETEL